MDEIRPFRSGVSFSEEKGLLYEFASNQVTVMAAWPRILAWRRSRSEPRWQHCRPEIKCPGRTQEVRRSRTAQGMRVGRSGDQWMIWEPDGQLVFPFVASAEIRLWKRGEAYRRWFERVPEDVRKILHRFPTRTWHLLSFFRRCGSPGLDLARSNPPLAWMLASNWCFRKPAVRRPLRSARALLRCGKKQVDILEWLGFPGTQSTRRIVRKVADKTLSVPRLLYLRDALRQDPSVRLLRHVPRINAGIIRLVSDQAFLPHVSPSLLQDIAMLARHDGNTEIGPLMTDTVQMGQILGTRIPVFRNMHHLTETHNSFVHELNHGVHADLQAYVLPPPPVRGNASIVPLDTMSALIDEGRHQHNCVASYGAAAACGSSYLYRVLQPERATLSIVQVHRKWEIDQLLLKGNEPAADETWDVVYDWLEGENRRKQSG